MRRAKTTEILDLSAISENKRRLSRQEANQQKIDRLRVKFRSVVQKINALKHETTQDYQRLLNSNQRIERMAMESQEKARRLGIDSIDGKQTPVVPVNPTREISTFICGEDVVTESRESATMTIETCDRKQSRKLSTETDERENVFVAVEGEYDRMEGQELRRSQQQCRKCQNIAEFSKATRISSIINEPSKLQKSVKGNAKAPTRQNRFLRAARVPPQRQQGTPDPKPARQQPKQQTIQPYIWAIAFSIILLAALAY